MAVYKPTIPVREGHVLTVDGEKYHVLRRVDGPDHGDTFVVENDGDTTERHIDWFRDITADADRIVIEREGVSEGPIEELEPGEYVDLDSGIRVVRSEDGDDAMLKEARNRTHRVVLSREEISDLAKLLGIQRLGEVDDGV